MKFIPLATLLVFLLGLSLQTAIGQARACTVSVDSDGDGMPEEITTNTYDANGNLLTESEDTDADGTPNSIETNTYDANGNLLTESEDLDGDGTPDKIFTYTYDANGNLLTLSRDDDGDGTPDRIFTYTYDSNGNLLTESTDFDADGTPDFIVTNTYDAAGNILTQSEDDNGDGMPDLITTNTYDANGNILTQSRDNDGDGTSDETIIYTRTYDAAGNILTQSEDLDGDGTPDRITTNTYDANGNILTQSEDNNGDGTPNKIRTYTYDANGNLLTFSEDNNGDGTLDRIVTLTYDANGNRLTESQDNDGDGTPDDTITNTYDANGNLLMESRDFDGDGTPDRIITYTYGNCTITTCSADAGELGNSQNAASLSICEGTDNGVVFEKSGASMDEYAFLLVPTNAVVAPIIAHNSTGDFDLTTLAAGDYRVYGLSYASSNTPSTIAAYLMGKSIDDVKMDDAGTTFCLDLSNTTVAGETNSLTVNANPSASLAVTETSGGTNNDGIVANGDPFTLTASGSSSYQFFIDQNNNGTFESASDTNLGTSNPLNATAGSTNFPLNMTTKVSVIATNNSGCTSTAATQDIEVLNTVNINAAVVNTCTRPYTANFTPVANAVAYRVEIVVPAPFGRTIVQTIGMPPLSSTINIPNRLMGQMVSIRIAPIFVDPNTGQQVLGMFSSPRNFTLGCNPNPATGGGVEGRSEEIVKKIQLQIAPNPVQADLQIRLEQVQAQAVQIQILDMTGRSLRSIEQESEIGDNQWTISIGELPAGLYYLQVRSAESVKVLSFVKE